LVSAITFDFLCVKVKIGLKKNFVLQC
jgi:hypothetical protein